MDHIDGLTKEQTIVALIKYYEHKHEIRKDVHDMFICNFVSDHSRAIGSDIWKFLFHWYRHFGYPYSEQIQVYNGCALFWHIKNDGIPNKVAERKQFIKRILENINN